MARRGAVTLVGVMALAVAATTVAVGAQSDAETALEALDAMSMPGEPGVSSPASAGCPQKTKGQLDLPLSEIARGGIVRLRAGTYYHVGSLELGRPVELVGAGPALTKLSFCIGSEESSIHVVSSGVTIRQLAIDVRVHNALWPGGGNGEFGTAVTVGRFLDSNPAALGLIENTI